MNSFRNHPGWYALSAALRIRWWEENRPCAICGERPKDESGQPNGRFAAQDVCHMVAKSWMADHGFEDAVTDERLMFCADRACHDDHDRYARNGTRRLTRDQVPQEAWDAAKEHHFLWKLEKEFPPISPNCPNCKRDLDDLGFCVTCGYDSAHRSEAA